MELTADLAHLDEVARRLLGCLSEHTVVFLRGDLAAGKTTLVQAVAKALGETQSVTSPTFSLQHRYGDRLFHYDLYRIDTAEFERLGLIEEFDKRGRHFVEWGDAELEKLLRFVGYDVVVVNIDHQGDQRRYRITCDA